MKNLIANQISNILSMTSKDRNVLLCKLVVKEHLNIIDPEEIIQLATIQSIREVNGEIEAVLKNWEKNPDCDPRI